MDKIYGIACPDCGHCPPAMTFNDPTELPEVFNYYLAHLIMYHWDIIVGYKEQSDRIQDAPT